jgi:hypothetical protein
MSAIFMLFHFRPKIEAVLIKIRNFNTFLGALRACPKTFPLKEKAQFNQLL